MAQKEAKRLDNIIRKAPVNSTKVCDGVSIGMRLAACRVERPWLIPNDLEEIHQEMRDLMKPSDGDKPVTVKRASLYKGSSLNKYTMISNKRIRRILWELAVNKPVTRNQYKELEQWVHTQRPELQPYLKIEAQVFSHPILVLCAK